MEQKMQEFLAKYEIAPCEHIETVLDTSTTCLVVRGCVGSGKTQLFLSRLAYLLESEAAQKEQMLNLVVDASSARMMKQAYRERYGCEKTPNFVDIFSFAYRIVSFYDEKNQNTRKVFSNMQKAADKILRAQFKLICSNVEIERLLQKVYQCKLRLLNEKRIAEIKMDNIDFAAFYNAYEKFKKQKKIYDKADVLQEALHILMYDKEMLELYQQRFAYITIDDAQELSYAGQMLIRILQAHQAKLCAFVNPQVSCDLTYDADATIFDAWKDDYEDYKEVVLTTTHRLNSTLCELTNRFIPSTMTTASTEECEIKYKGFSEWKKMYDYALKRVEEKEEVAFLYREDAIAIPLIEHLVSNQIAVNFQWNIKSFLNDSIVKDMVNFLSLFINPRNMRAFFEVHKYMGLDMSNRMLLEIDGIMSDQPQMDIYQSIIASSYKASGKRLLSSYMEDIREVSGGTTFDMLQFVLEKFAYDANMRKERRTIQDPVWIALQILAAKYPDPREFLEVLRGLINISSSEHADVYVLPLRAAYGRQYSCVCMIDCFAHIYPKFKGNAYEGAFERRLFYMGMSRAVHHLELFTAKNCFGTRLEMSPYIYELHGKRKEASKPKAVSSRLREQDFKRGVRIEHASLGKGTIKRVKDGMMEVVFAEENKMLNIKLCIKNKLVKLV
ncbi:MAG: UvrD-helicase domain-containing protein [Amedibacillus dolichus]|jgi:hypothetical protein|uniref:DNA 3'-5' helicase n=1 Tax=Amedibacillus dolichus TaxID=31971 RepID=A0A943A3G2_9FIRM|nr:UvrD-helicase domain-containing protein [Amedibacillus dolichus]MBS4884470.1 UvrD-helicase domain-containing protein [Amedibacillus dolichus]MEE0384470.1 UvrD-helicase domain-containing protein [Amedibacillus dolichus]